jgi:quercetin dioxygenase-like cupin family protein
VEFYKFDKGSGKEISKFNSSGFTMSRIILTEKVTNIGCMYLEENGVVGYHQAVTPQLLFITSGEGYVRGETEEYYKVRAGDAVFWRKDEWHETKTDIGLTAFVMQSEDLNPSSFMSENLGVEKLKIDK